MRTEVIQADTIDAAVECILHELREDSSTRSIRNRENVIYFDGWDGLGASAVLRDVGQRLAVGLQSSEGPAGLQFDQIIHIDFSNWESRRALQRIIVEQLELPAEMMEILDRRDEEDDLHGVPQGSRNEVTEVLDATYQHIQTLRHRFLVIFQNGSDEEMDLIITTFGFPLYGYSRNKLLWTFQGSLRLYPRVKVDRVLKSTATTDIFLSASRCDQDPLELWRYLVHQEAAQVACRNAAGTGSLLDLPAALVSECFFYTLKQCCMGSQEYDLNTPCSNYWMCDGIIHLEKQGDHGDNRLAAADDDDCVLWRAADALQREMRLDGDYYIHEQQYLVSHLVKYAEIIPCWTSPSYRVTQILDDGAIANRGIFQHYDKLCVLKLSRCSFSFSSPPFLRCHSLRFLWLDHCQDSNQETNSNDEASAEEEEEMRCCFQRLWVLDVRYTPCVYWILSPQMMDLMTQLRELNVMGTQDWDVGHLHGRLPNIRKLRVTKSTVCCTGRHSEDDFLSSMNKLELLDFSGNRAMQEVGGAEKVFGISTSSNQLETVMIIDGCVGIQKFSCRGCAKLKNLLLSGLFEDLRILDLSGTAVKTLDLSAMTAQSLDELILDNCDKLCAILWPPEDKRNMDLPKVHIDTTQSASTSRGGGEILKDGSNATNIGSSSSSSSSSWPMVLVNGARQPSEFNWYISIKDARFLRSFVPYFENYFRKNSVHLEISSPSFCPTVDVSGSENEGIKNKVGEEPPVLSNRWWRQRQRQPQYNNNTSMYYADVATIIVEEHLLQGGEGNSNDAPTITRTRPCPSPYRRLHSSGCYLYTQDQQIKTKAAMDDDGGAIATIPRIICDNAYILHVHDSLYNTSIPASPAQWNNLGWCRMERCPRLDFIFTAPQFLGGVSSVRMCWCLRTFWASQLPRTRFMWDTSKLPLSQIHKESFEDLELLHLDFCARLIHVLPFAPSVNRHNLETLEIVWCGDLRVVFPILDTENTESHQKQQQHQKKPPGATITTVDFPNLKHIHLHELPKLQSICGLGETMYAPELETIKIRGCWSLTHLPAVGTRRSSNKVECDCEKEWWDRLEWDGLDGKHQPSLYKPVHSRYYKKKLLRGSVLK